MAWWHTDRGVSPVIAHILLVVIVIIVASTTAVTVFGAGEEIRYSAPAVAFETEVEEKTILIRHTGGESIEMEHLRVRGGDITGGPEDTFEVGTTLSVDPDEKSLELLWEGEDTSFVLRTLDATPIQHQPRGQKSIILSTNGDEAVEVGDSVKMGALTIEISDDIEGTYTVEFTCPGNSTPIYSGPAGDEITPDRNPRITIDRIHDVRNKNKTIIECKNSN